MARRTVLYIGLDPVLVDFTSMPDLDADKVNAGIRADVARMAEHGYDAVWFPVDRGETAAGRVAAELQSRAYDAVVIGAGIRAMPAHLLLFERLVNVIHEHAPTAKLCFNTRPTDTLEAVQRWV